MPNAGVLLTGHAHAPAGRAVPSMSVRLGISREKPVIDKTLHVFGARAAANASTISPFQKMPLVYERAFGGAGVWENPVGVGGPRERELAERGGSARSATGGRVRADRPAVGAASGAPRKC